MDDAFKEKARNVESFKQEIGFDDGLLALLLPAAHPKASHRTHPVTGPWLLQRLSQVVDPVICEFVVLGYKKVPRSAFSQGDRGREWRRRYSLDQRVRGFLREFVQQSMTRHSKEPDRRRIRNAARRLEVTVEEAINRSKLAVFLDPAQPNH